MIINLPFGYAARHHIYFDTQLKRGTIKLWSSYSGSITGADPIEKGEGFLTELLAHQDSQRGSFFGANQHTEFLIADEKDVLSILASLVEVKNKGEFSFTSKEGRKITLSLGKAGKWETEIIIVNVQYGKAGKLTIKEANKLYTIAREILSNLGYSDQEISEKIERITKDSPN